MSVKSVRIQDVARAAGVSTATVSRALSNPELVAKETRDSVQEAIRTTGYRLNRAARNLRRMQAGAVLVLVPNLGNPFFSQILAGISAGFARSDRSVLIADTCDLPQTSRRLVDYFLDARVDGMISLDGGLGRKNWLNWPPMTCPSDWSLPANGRLARPRCRCAATMRGARARRFDTCMIWGTAALPMSPDRSTMC